MKNPTGITIVIILILIGSAIVITAGKVPGLPGVWEFLPKTLTLDESWYIVYNDKDQYDSWCAQQLREEYGANLLSIYTSNFEVLNGTGVNLLFIGGGKEFSGKVPWIETWPTLSIVKQPGGFPDIYTDNDGTWNNAWIHTPLTTYWIEKDGEWLHDYGFIARGYDQELERWVIVALGWSATCTGAATMILIEDFDRVRAHSWIVYEISKDTWAENQNVNLWRLDLFNPKIVAQG